MYSPLIRSSIDETNVRRRTTKTLLLLRFVFVFAGMERKETILGRRNASEKRGSCKTFGESRSKYRGVLEDNRNFLLDEH